MNNIANIDIKELANEFSTPTYVYDAEQFRTNYKKLKVLWINTILKIIFIFL